MKLNAWAACLLFAGLAAVSCIKAEAPNSEADIESCTLAGDVLNRDPVIENDKVTLHLKKGSALTSLSPEFTLTPGATISPASGTTRDFTTPQTYEVTSEGALEEAVQGRSHDIGHDDLPLPLRERPDGQQRKVPNLLRNGCRGRRDYDVGQR